MTKFLVGVATLLLSTSSWAAMCNVDLANEVQITGQSVAIVNSNGQTAMISANDNLSIEGKNVPLNNEQKKGLDSYREHVSQYAPAIKQFIGKNLTFADNIVDEVSKNLGAPNAFDSFKKSMRTFAGDIQSQYYKGDSLILPANTFESAKAQLPTYYAKAKSLFDTEFVNQAFNVMSTKMNQNGGINLTEFSNKISTLKKQVEVQLNTHSAQLKQQGKKMCQSLNELKREEQSLHKEVPELEGYSIFKK
ncbi:DUF2884 family protein [Vibrio marisflavi]|uniref:DUF2884 family protein n=1 Tax=Vibrio marisflavi CECT 7928 TaxID=634439 RepID=A0ABM9A6N7_9VIBR|nr:DUF2884 family protein [Vibrio marisflavi]CAH0541011.1 hypothetical protein VMF7928_03309 [Vibrio marisflavi CECT 7928]